MKKTGRILGIALAIALGSVGTAAAETGEPQPAVIEAQEERIEQVSANLPQVRVYGSGFSAGEVQEAQAYLSQEKLELVQAGPFSESGEGVCYYVLLDISGSIPGSYFQKIKEGIQNLQDQLGENDRLVLCAFGEQVVLAADGSQTAEELARILEQLDNRDQKTLLFEGIDRVASLADQAKKEGRFRTVLAVISDGEDIAVGQKRAQEAQEKLKEKGLPVYAFCIRDTASVNINTFGEFARTSGGRLVVFLPEEGSGILCDLAASLADDLYLEYRAATNVVTNKEELFNLKFADERVLSRPVYNNRWIPDSQPPRLLSAEAAGTRQIRLVFSEPMRGVETTANFHLSLDGEPVTVTGVSCDKKTSSVVTLSLEEPVQNAVYMLDCSGITDDSMEKNPPAGELELSIANAPEPVQGTEEAREPGGGQETDIVGILFLIFAVLLALVIVLVAKGRKKKAKPPETEAGRKLDVWVCGRDGGTRKSVWYLANSLVVGRSSTCDIHLDDPEMSRQHFCLEAEDDTIYVTDLGSTNGTDVNGVRLMGKQRLDPGAVIEAGSVKITVRW